MSGDINGRPEFTLSQQKLIAIIPMITGALSIIGSSLIIHMTLRSLKCKNSRLTKNCKMYYRLLLGMSMMDVLQSTAQSFSSLPMPKGNPNVYGAIGNKATCSIQGFIGLLGCAVPMYNGALAVYYLLTVRYNVREDTLRERVEPMLHLLCICYPLIMAAVALAFDLYGPERAYICQVSPSSDDTQHKRTNEIKTYFMMALVFSTFALIFIVCVCMALVALSVFESPKPLSPPSVIPNKSDSVDDTSCTTREAQQQTRKSYYDYSTKKAVVTQAGYYALFCVLTLFFAVLDSILVMAQDSRVFAVTICTKIFFPLQGFFNYFIFVRPRVNRLLQSQDISFLAALYEATFPPRCSVFETRNLNHGKHKKQGGKFGSPSEDEFDSSFDSIKFNSSISAGTSVNAVAFENIDENVKEEHEKKRAVLNLNHLPVITE